MGNDNSTVDRLWKEAKALHAAKQELLAKIGGSYIELEELNEKGRQCRAKIEELKAQLVIIDTSFDSTVTGIVRANGVKDGEWVLDLDNQRVVTKNGQISDSCDSQS